VWRGLNGCTFFVWALLVCFDGRFDVAFLEARQVADMPLRPRSR